MVALGTWIERVKQVSSQERQKQAEGGAGTREVKQGVALGGGISSYVSHHHDPLDSKEQMCHSKGETCGLSLCTFNFTVILLGLI